MLWALACSAGCSASGAAPARQRANQGVSDGIAGTTGGGFGAAGAAGAAEAGAQQPPSSSGGSTQPAAAGMGPGAAPPGDFAAQLPEPNPSIMFEWTQTRPGQGECQPGRYVGVFSCEYGAMPDVPGVLVTGPVEFVLERSQNGEFLEIADGQLDGVAQLLFGFRSRLEGRLDCATNLLEARAVDGVWGFGDPSLLPAGTFEGTLMGLYDRTRVALDGTWSLSAMDMVACEGPWNASFTP